MIFDLVVPVILTQPIFAPMPVQSVLETTRKIQRIRMFNAPKLQRCFPNRFLCRWAVLSIGLALFWAVSSAPVRAQATITNTVQFSAAVFFADENALSAVISATRLGDSTEFTSVDYFTTDGTAISGIDYFGVRGTLSFLPGEIFATFFIPIFDNFAQDGNRTINLFLTDVRGTGAALGNPSQATCVIRDDETAGTFTSAGQVEIATGNSGAYSFMANGTYEITQTEWITNDITIDWDNITNWEPSGPAGAQVTIIRKGGSRGRILVDWATTTNVVPSFPPSFFGGFFGTSGGGIAQPNIDFVPTNGTVALDDFQMSTNVIVNVPTISYGTLLSTNGLIISNLFDLFSPPKTFGVVLSNVRAAPEEANNGVAPTLGIAQRTVDIARNFAGFAFDRLHYEVSEGQGVARIRVKRSFPIDQGVSVRYVINPLHVIVVDTGGDHLNNEFPLENASDYAAPFVDFEPPSSDPWRLTTERTEPAQLRWDAGDSSDKFIEIPIINDSEVEFNEDMWVLLYKLYGETDGVINPWADTAIVKILFDDQPAGAVDRDFNVDNNADTDPPYITRPGANNTVQAMALQPDGKIVIGGDFSSYNTVPRSAIARANLDGSIDRTFNPGTGVATPGFVSAVAVQNDGKIVVGGWFDAINGIRRDSIARLHTNGVLDASFNPGIGADGPIRTIALQSDGKILIGGEFLSYDGTNRNYIARLNSNGLLDTTFDPAAGPDGPVNSIAVTAGALHIDREASGGQAEDRYLVDTGSARGTITINFDFLTVPDTLRVYYDNVRIYDSGLVSGVQSVTIPYGLPNSASTFVEIVINEGSGLPGTIWFYNLLINPFVDERPVIGGSFTSYNGVERNFIARLNLDGSLDTSFYPGTGADDVVYAVAKQGNKVIMGGDFSSVDLRKRNGVARLNEDGSLDTGYDTGSGVNNSVYAIVVEPNGKAVLGGNFTSINSTRRVALARLNLDGSLDTSFMDTAYNQFAGLVNPLSPENVQSQENFVRALGAYRFTNITVLTNIVITNSVTNEIILTNISMIDHLFIGGKFSRVGGGFRRDDIRNRNNFARIISGATPGPGNIAFAKTTYTVDEDAGRTFITLVRTNGSLGPVGAAFAAADRPPGGPGVAKDGADYLSTNRVPIWKRSHVQDRKFSDAFMGPNNRAVSTNRTRGDFNIYPFPFKPPLRFDNYDDDNIFVSILDDNLIEGDEVLSLTLSNPDGTRLFLGGEPIPLGTALGRAGATLIIADNDFNFGTLGFSDPVYTINENGTNATITVTRVGGSSGAVTVDAFTTDGTANSLDYAGIVPKRTLTFANGMTSVKFTISIKNDTMAEFEETVNLWLTNATGFPSDILLEKRLDPARSAAVLTIIDDDFAPGRVSFDLASFDVNENEPAATITVKRTGGNLGTLTMDYATSDGSARAGTDYTAVSGTLHWEDGDTAMKSFTVPIRDNLVVESDKVLNLALSNPMVQNQPNPNATGIRPTATLKILNDDAYGNFAFSQETYNVDENGPYSIITVLRLDGMASTISVDFTATNLTAVAGVDFVATNNTLTFLPGETSKSFHVRLIDDSIVEGDKLVSLTLFNPKLGALTTPNVATLRIIDNELTREPAGSLDTTFNALGTDEFVYTLALQENGHLLVGGDFGFVNNIVRRRLARLQPDGTLDPSFDPVAGPNNSVRTITVERDGRILIGGLFSSINNTNRNYLARLNIDSNVDPTFNPGAGTDNPVYATVLQSDGKAIIGGDFATYRGVARSGIARVNTNGVLDVSFNPGTGANGTIYAVALQADGKVLVGGDFTAFNEVPRNCLARLNRDGSLDLAFVSAPGMGADRSVRSIIAQSDRKVLIGGLFTTINGKTNVNRVARLNAEDGTLDAEFNPGTAADGPVNVIALQIDGKILLGGDFSTFNGVTRNRITRLNSDGSVDPAINFGSGANATVSSILLQPDRKIVIGGGFTIFNGQPRRHLARIHGGSMAGPGSLEFNSPFFTVNENATNALITVRRIGGTTGSVAADCGTRQLTATPNVDYIDVSTNLVFPQGEVVKNFLVPVRTNALVLHDITVSLSLSNLTGGAVLGAQPTATLTILNVDSVIGFSSPAYSVNENSVAQSASITVTRTGTVAYTNYVEFFTSDGTATNGLDYAARSFTLEFRPGETSKTFIIPIINDALVEGNETVNLILTNAVPLGGSVRLSSNLATSVLTIVDDDFAPGQLSFSAPFYSVTESGARAAITVRRSAGTTGVISVDYGTSDGTATSNPGGDYKTARGILSFADGETVRSFDIEILDDIVVEGNETVIVTLSRPTGGATLVGPNPVILTIVDDDLGAGSLDQTFNPGTGAEAGNTHAAVRSLKLQADGQILIGGDFTRFHGDSNHVRVARLNLDGSPDNTFKTANGPNNSVQAIELSAGKVLIAGAFNTIGTVVNNRVARLSATGTFDSTFNLPLGLNAEVNTLALQPDGKVFIGGMFTGVSAAGRNRITRLNGDGNWDDSFNPGSGADNTVHSIVLQSNGKVIVGGAFTAMNGSSHRGITRLHPNGLVDASFDPGTGANGAVYSVLLQKDGKIVVAGSFTAINGNTNHIRIARLNADGSLDAAFDHGLGTNKVAGIGPDNAIYAMALQEDGKIIIGGDFTQITALVTNAATKVVSSKFVSRTRIARLNQDGSLDESFDPGYGANDTVLAVAVQLDGKVLLAGKFSEVDRVNRNGLARLNGDPGLAPASITINEVARDANGQVSFVFVTQAGRSYVIETSTDLVNWTQKGTVSATASTAEFTDLNANPARGFYRVRRVGP